MSVRVLELLAEKLDAGWQASAPTWAGAGTRVGTGVGGRVYSTTSVEADTPELAVAFASAVILPIVELPPASTSAALRFPLEAADVVRQSLMSH